jgi:hypothetical protein
MNYYITVGDQQKGPYTRSQLESMWSQGALTSDAFYCRAGMNEWRKIQELMQSIDSAKGQIAASPLKGFTDLIHGLARAGFSSARRHLKLLILIGGLISLLLVSCATIIVVAKLGTKWVASPNTVLSSVNEPEEVEISSLPSDRQKIFQYLIKMWEYLVGENKQNLFEWFNGISGAVTSAEINDITVEWQSSSGTKIANYTVVYTLYWKDRTKEGYTKVQAKTDEQKGKVVSIRVLASSGATVLPIGTELLPQ